jgi:hypothetical protein
MLRYFLFTLLVVTGICLLPTARGPLPAAEAAKVKVWLQGAPSHYEKAHLKQIVVSSEGALRLSRELKPLVGLDATHVWDIVEDKQGNLYAATGDEGKIYQITPQGKISVAFDSQESQILCLALAPDGSIYAGTGPSGLIVRIGTDGKSRVIYQSPETYVWSLTVDAKGQNLYAGTGPKGRIYQVSPDGKASVFYTTKQEHVLCLTMDPQGMLYAGTDKNGLVYRIDPKGKGFVVFSAPQAEVRSLLVTPDGLYAGTSAPSRHHGSGNSIGNQRSSSSSPDSPPGLTSAASKKDPGSASTSNGSSPAPSSLSDRDKGGSAKESSPPSSGENSVYRIRPDGTVREVFREKALMLSLLKQGGRIIVGTGMEGQLFEIDEASKERSEIARLDHGQIHCLYHRLDGSVVLGTGDPGKLYVLQDKYAAKGTVVSEVLDAKIISKWGALRWKADMPAGTSVSVAVRSGNVAEPDDTWSDWSVELTDPRQAAVTAPTARFLQYRLTLVTENPAITPTLRSLSVRYMTTNQAPEVTRIEVPDLDGANLENPKKIKFTWTAVDPNEDDLTYHLFVRKDGWKNWVQLEEDFDKKEYEWDTTTTPSGVYRLKVVASDRKDNSPEDALTGEKVSEPFIVSHTPPTVTIKVAGTEGDQAIIEATATDPLVRLTGASFSVNGKKWINVFPTDGLFDSKKESFRFKTDSLKPGTYVLVLRVKDAAGNTGSGDAVFTVKENSR